MRYQTDSFRTDSGDCIACPCCGNGGLSIPLLIVLEELRKHFNAPVTVTSGARCETHNASVGGAKNSEHKVTELEPNSDAADIKVKGFSPTQVYMHLKGLPYASLLGLGKYKSWVHVDVRGYAARW